MSDFKAFIEKEQNKMEERPVENIESELAEKKNRRTERAARAVKYVFIAVGIGLLLTLLSVYVPITVKGVEGLDDMRYGKPIAFFVQKFARTVPEEKFPVMVTPKFSSGYSTEIEIPLLCLSWAINTAVAGAVWAAAVLIKGRKKSKREKKTV